MSKLSSVKRNKVFVRHVRACDVLAKLGLEVNVGSNMVNYLKQNI
jgi:ABC-type enterochelin transport system substrate-binding protein